MYNLRSRQVPRKKLDSEQAEDRKSTHQSSSTGLQSTCGICFELIEKNKARLEPCGHLFHDACALTWNKISSNCAICRTPAEIINVQVDQTLWRLVWIVPGRFFALVERNSDHVLSIGATEANASLILKVDDQDEGRFAMDISNLPGKLTTYSCSQLSLPSRIYYIRDCNGVYLQLPKVIRD